MITKRKIEPQLDANEEVILNHPGFFKDNPRSGWKPGHLYLTNTRLFLWQPARLIFQTALQNIKEINIQPSGFILRSKDALCISYIPSGQNGRSSVIAPCRTNGDRNQASPSGQGTSKAWLMVNDVETWKNRIFERSLLKITQGKIDQVIAELDPESRNVLLLVWQNRHAPINELAHTYNAPNHMDVLNRIRNIINPTSQRLIGFPALAFERSKIDESTGKKIMFSWWIIGDNKLEKDNGDSLLDIFDEGDHLNIIMELKGAREEDILLGVDENKLTVSCKTPGTHYNEEITLPSKVDREGIIRKYHNHILEIRLPKAENSGQTDVGGQKSGIGSQKTEDD